MQIRVTAEKAKSPARLSSFLIQVRLASPLDDQYKAGLLRAIRSCLIHNTLLNPPKIELQLDAPNVELAAA
jgi:hypothetical protein